MFEREPPADIYLDTSIIVAAIVAGSEKSEDSLQFCQWLANGASRVYFSQIIRLELTQAFLKLATRKRLPEEVWRLYGLAEWGNNFMVRQGWLSFAVAQFEAFIGQFEEAFELPYSTTI